MVAMAKKAWFALMNWKTRMGSLRSPVRTRPLPLPRCRAPGAVADSHGADGSAPSARRWSGRPVGGHHRDRPVVPNSKSPGQSVRTRATAPPVFAQIGPDQPSVAGIPAHRVGDSSALMAPPSQVERCPPNRVNSNPAEAGNRSCCAQPRAARIAGLRTAPLPARSSPASQQSGDGGLPGKKIALDLQLPDLPWQIVDHLLRTLGRRRLAAAPEQLTRTLHQLLLPVADHRRMNPKLRRQLRQGLFPRKRRHRHPRLEFCAVLLPLYAHVSRPFGPVSL